MTATRDVDESVMVVSSSIILDMDWKDPRFVTSLTNQPLGIYDSLGLSDFANRQLLWRPPIHIMNLVELEGYTLQ